ncbi:hypothetical protein [Xanthomonas sp. CFBP 8445]|uniref:hypothetical protein n=1 Tax=Xanthomonas sp. CFBP 8445 TaxID=2971236 RepID=UPI0021DF4A7C|nr:hypothetical protein [Xanthomonas sp. CFBP 8445]UYC12999.1 hypothetical protein NUG21_04410 [Xanthomonas sp. CFBP 8445]
MRGYTPVCADSYEAMTTMSSLGKKICLVLVLPLNLGTGSRKGRCGGVGMHIYQLVAQEAVTVRGRAQMRMQCDYAAVHKLVSLSQLVRHRYRDNDAWKMPRRKYFAGAYN